MSLNNEIIPIEQGAFTKITKSATNGLLYAWNEITGTARAIAGVIDPDLPKKDLLRIKKQMLNCITPKGGEVTARNNTIELGKTYLGLSEIGKERFFTLLLENFDTDKAEILNLLETLSKKLNYKNQEKLMKAMNAKRKKIFTQFLALTNGLKFIVDMRADLLRIVKQNPNLGKLENEIRQILLLWFDVGLLDMQRITWRSSAYLLEKLIAYEAVHQISSWNDLRNRLDSDRRCFAFFHYKMPDEPLIFVEVALYNNIASNIQDLLDESAPILQHEKANTAVFYSISNSQKGLVGINLGNFLIKKVVQELAHELPNIKHFITLSPIPCFVKWIKANIETLDFDKEETKNEIEDAITCSEMTKEEIKQELVNLCAYYLLCVKKGIKTYDPVANFHLSNGANLKQINWQANNTKKGYQESFGIMVNYHYELNKIEDNHENYMSNGTIAATKFLYSLSKKVKLKTQ